MRVGGLAEKVLHCPYHTLGQSIALSVIRAAGHMLEVVLLGKICHGYRRILWSIVCDQDFWNTVSRKDGS
jgi:hypothetical protein